MLAQHKNVNLGENYIGTKYNLNTRSRLLRENKLIYRRKKSLLEANKSVKMINSLLRTVQVGLKIQLFFREPWTVHYKMMYTIYNRTKDCNKEGT